MRSLSILKPFVVVIPPIIIFCASVAALCGQDDLANLNKKNQSGYYSAQALAATAETIQTYTPEELAARVSPLVYEIHTRWKAPSLLLFSKNGGTDGTAVVLKRGPKGIFLVTNRHVVEPPPGSTDISHTANNGQPVEIIAYARNGLDLALLKLQSEDSKDSWEMPTLQRERVTIGQSCIAIGNALGGGPSVTSGIISRFDNNGSWIAIRTSAPISPGNSGGGLFSLKGGQLIGVTTSSRTEKGAQNVNFVIPADYFTGEAAWDYLLNTPSSIVTNYLEAVVKQDWKTAGEMLLPSSLERRKDQMIGAIKNSSMNEEAAKLNMLGVKDVKEFEALSPQTAYIVDREAVHHRMKISDDVLKRKIDTLKINILGLFPEEDGKIMHAVVRTKQETNDTMIEELLMISLIQDRDNAKKWFIVPDMQQPLTTPLRERR